MVKVYIENEGEFIEINNFGEIFKNIATSKNTEIVKKIKIIDDKKFNRAIIDFKFSDENKISKINSKYYEVYKGIGITFLNEDESKILYNDYEIIVKNNSNECVLLLSVKIIEDMLVESFFENELTININVF